MRQKTKMLICETLVADGADVTIASRLSMILSDDQMDMLAGGVITHVELKNEQDTLLDKAVRSHCPCKLESPIIIGLRGSGNTVSIRCTGRYKTGDKDKYGDGTEDFEFTINLGEHPEFESCFNLTLV